MSSKFMCLGGGRECDRRWLGEVKAGNAVADANQMTLKAFGDLQIS